MQPSEPPADEVPKPVAEAIDEAVPEELRDTAYSVVKAIAEEAQQRPLLALLVAALVGYLFATLTS